jgi:hypothetical protein
MRRIFRQHTQANIRNFGWEIIELPKHIPVQLLRSEIFFFPENSINGCRRDFTLSVMDKKFKIFGHVLSSVIHASLLNGLKWFGYKLSEELAIVDSFLKNKELLFINLHTDSDT